MCSREEVGAGFERRESKRESNRATSGAYATLPWRTQIGAEPRVVLRNPEMKKPNRERLGAEILVANGCPCADSPPELTSTGAGCCRSSAQQAASKHGLHVSASVRNQVNDDFAVCDAVDHTVRLEQGLAVFFDPKAD